MKKIFTVIFSEEEIPKKYKKILGVCFAILAIIFGCLWYYCPKSVAFLRVMSWPFGGNFFDGYFASNIKFEFPGYTNQIWGLLLCFPIYLRRFIPFKTLSPFCFISFALNWLLFSVIAQLIFGASGSFTNNTLNTIFILSLGVSWLGIRSFAGFGWVAVFILAMINLFSADYHLKHFGFLFLFSAFSSFMFQSSFTPEQLFKKILSEFRGVTNSSQMNFMKESMNEAVSATGNAVKSAVPLAMGKIV